MSRYDGWLVRYIMMVGTAGRLSIRDAARGACVRPEQFRKALDDRELLSQDARHLGINPSEWRDLALWLRQVEAEAQVLESMAASARAVTRTPSSDKYKGGPTCLGTRCPHPPRDVDDVGLPLSKVDHPEPQGEWHPDLDRSGKAVAEGR